MHDEGSQIGDQHVTLALVLCCTLQGKIATRWQRGQPVLKTDFWNKTHDAKIHDLYAHLAHLQMAVYLPAMGP